MFKDLTIEEIESRLENIKQSPKDAGVIVLLVCRPATDERQIITKAKLELQNGLEGDNWKTRGSKSTPDKSADPEAQITLMNSRVIDLLTEHQNDWQLAGDQIFVDFDLSLDHLPPHSKIQVGSAILEISAKPHTGCKKFSDRFGIQALEFISTPQGKSLRMRGVNARVIQAGEIHVGDVVRKVSP